MKRIVKILSLLFVIVSLFGIASTSYGYVCDYNYPYIYDAYWNNYTARWNVDGYADRYEVSLYRNGYRVVTKTVYTRSYDFYSYMSGRGNEYYFEVRPYNYRTGWGNWISSSCTYVKDSYYYGRDCYRDYDRYGCYYPYGVSYARNDGPPKYQSNVGSVASSNVDVRGVSVTVPEPQVVHDKINGLIPTGTFFDMNGNKYYAYLNGAFATNTWIESKGKWYYFDTTGTMVRGLYTINNKTYYLNPDGSMATGMIFVNGVTHYFDANGVMVY